MATPAFPKGIDLKNQRAQNLADGTSATDGVTLQQLQAMVRGLSWKDEVRAASTANGTLASAFANGSSMDGISLVTGDRILLKDQTTAQENGIYTVNSSGAPTRAPDADATTELENATCFVMVGTVNADKAFTQTATVTTVGTTPQNWVQFGGGVPVTAGNGLTGSSTISILLDTGSGMSVSSSGLKNDPTIMARVFAQNCAATTNPQTFTHGLGKKPLVQILDSAGSVTYPDIVISPTTVVVDWGTAPAASDYTVIAVG